MANRWQMVSQPSSIVGLDLGQARDYTAIVVLERSDWVGQERDPVTYEFQRETRLSFRHLERVPLRTPYPDVVSMVRRVVGDLREGRRELVMDATGVGRPVVDLLRRADLRCPVIPVLITGGDGESEDRGMWRVPKRDLVTGLQVAFEKRWVGVADCGEATQAFVSELLATRVRVSADGHVRWGAVRGHDDLVMAAALAWWRVRRVWPG